MIFRRFIKIIRANLKPIKKVKEPLPEWPDSRPTKIYSQSFESIKTDPMSKIEAEYYANLELKPGVGLEEIKTAYKKLMKLYHPDIHNQNIDQRKAAELITSRLNEAYNYFENKYKESKNNL